ncbi:MAG: sigma-54 dependent transcriptional regulator [Planctomycetes bacterium]|nr:sigma-54 dependent transcriptional regulator [Planctomycetota bacterium]
MKILLCDDEPLLRATLSDDLEDAGHSVELVSDGNAALERLAAGTYDCVVTDMAMPGADGMQVLAAARDKNMDAVMITGHGSVGMAVEAMRLGAYDFLEKPFLGDALVKILARITEKRAGARAGASRTTRAGRGFDGVVGGSSEKFRQMLHAARRAAASDASLLIIGESGSGKEVLAKAVHEDSARSRKPFVPVSCGAIAAGLLDDELFGHEKGAFTDAKTARAGRFEEAEGGTLFLDDIDDMRLDTQVKLLRVLQEREFRRIGAEESIKIDIRVIAASKVDLDLHAANGHFRTDLLYRLQVLRLDIPPLRERSEDIPELLNHFIAKHAQAAVPPLTLETLATVAAYAWPGNIRQLENAVCRALAMKNTGEELTATDLLPPGAVAADAGDLSLSHAVKQAERRHIEKVLAMCGGNRSKTAAILGISRKNLWEKMRQFSLSAEGEDTGVR